MIVRLEALWVKLVLWTDRVVKFGIYPCSHCQDNIIIGEMNVFRNIVD